MPKREDAERLAKEIQDGLDDINQLRTEERNRPDIEGVLFNRAVSVLETIIKTPSDKGTTSVKLKDGSVVKITITKEVTSE